jgi:hypothetical protein
VEVAGYAVALGLSRPAQRLLCPLALDALGDRIGHRRQRLDNILRELLAGKHSHDAHQPVLDDQGVAGEGHDPLPLSPLLVADAGSSRTSLVRCDWRS